VEYQQIAAAGFVPAFSTDVLPFFLFGGCGGCVVERCGEGMGGFVCGTLLGPEITGALVLGVSGCVFLRRWVCCPFVGWCAWCLWVVV